MTWSMPRPVLQLVAAVIAAACIISFVMGVLAPQDHGRLPGERAPATTTAGQPIQAQEATPLVDDRIQGAAQAPELSDEEKAKLDEEKEAKEAADAAAKAQAAAIQAPVAPVGPIVPSDKIGEALDKSAAAKPPTAKPAAPPKQDEPPF